MTAYLDRFRQSPAVLSRSVFGNFLVGDPDGRDLHLLEDSAALVWRLLETPRPLPELVRAVAGIYETSPDALRGDVEELLDGLVELRLAEAVIDNDV